MARLKTRYILTALATFFVGCRHQPPMPVSATGYPKHIEDIFLNKCATSGCHDNSGYINADGLNLSTWENLFKGGGTGAAVIAYRPDFSSLCYFINTDSTLGLVLQPTMPYNEAPLSRAEYLSIRDWIAAGAPNAAGEIKFADKPARQKIYVANRQCNVITVMDAASKLQMRYVNAGDNAGNRYPYCIKVSPDKAHWYVSFLTQTNIVQEFDAETDVYAGDLELGNGAWTSFAITADSKYGYFADNSAQGRIVYADLHERKVLASYENAGQFSHLTGVAISDHRKKVYVGTTNGDALYAIDVSDPLLPVIKKVNLDASDQPTAFDRVDIAIDESSGRCYIARSWSQVIEVLDMEPDNVVARIDLGRYPAFMAFSPSRQKLLVTAPNDSTSFPGNTGSVTVINTLGNTIEKRIKPGFLPYGIAINEELGFATVVNANNGQGGPASHHSSGCGKRNGNLTFIDLATLETIPGKNREVAVFPFAAASR